MPCTSSHINIVMADSGNWTIDGEAILMKSQQLIRLTIRRQLNSIIFDWIEAPPVEILRSN